MNCFACWPRISMNAIQKEQKRQESQKNQGQQNGQGNPGTSGQAGQGEILLRTAAVQVSSPGKEPKLKVECLMLLWMLSATVLVKSPNLSMEKATIPIWIRELTTIQRRARESERRIATTRRKVRRPRPGGCPRWQFFSWQHGCQCYSWRSRAEPVEHYQSDC